MDTAFWLERWRDGRIGFHEGRANALLEAHVERLGAGTRVLVPLCGKAEDLVWLAARGHQVVGVELAEQAVRAFFAEHALSPRETEVGALKRFDAGSIGIWQGDFFACTTELLGKCDAFYDRAALVALPNELRARYVSKLRELVTSDARGIVITFEYPQALMEGPPFSVPETELRTLYDGARVELLEERSVERVQFQALGDQLLERCFAVRL